MQRSQPIVILTIIVMAIILAAGSFLALMYIQGRPSAPSGTFTTNVEGIEVIVSMDPAKQVRVLGLEDIQANVVPEEQVVEPPPEQPQEPQEQAPAPTEVPPTPVPEPTAIPVPQQPVIFEEYVVQQNDSLYRIANRVDTAIVLMAVHGISQEDLVPGSVIQLPIGNPAYCPQDNRQPYAVGEGDTAYSIGKRFNISANELRDINALDENYTVYGASIICVPR